MSGSRVAGDPDRELQRAGRELVLALHGALRVLGLYPLENQAVQKAVAALESAARRIAEAEGALSLRHVADSFVVNDVRLRLDLSSYGSFAALGRALKRHGVGRLEVEPGAEPREWIALLTLLATDPGADAFASFKEHLESARVERIAAHPPADEQGGASRLSREAARRTYVQSVSAAREVMGEVRMGRTVGLRKVKRAVQSIVDQVLDNETSIVGMTALRDYDEYTFTHSVNVCIFSVALGKKLGLEKTGLYELGLGGLLHDVGKIRLPLEITNKPGRPSEAEWALIREHPTEGMLALLEMAETSELPLRSVLCVYEHHMGPGGSGYPTARRPRTPTIFPKIVGVADAFDAATTRRSYQPNPSVPTDVLGGLYRAMGTRWDPVLVKALISMTGFYPPGSVVILDTYELAVVLERSPTREALQQPVVRLLFDPLGVPLAPPRDVDLRELDPRTGRPARTIVKITEPSRYGIDVTRYLS